MTGLVTGFIAGVMLMACLHIKGEGRWMDREAKRRRALWNVINKLHSPYENQVFVGKDYTKADLRHDLMDIT